MELSEHINGKSYYDAEYVKNVYPHIFDKCDKDDIISIRKMKKSDYCYARYLDKTEKWELCNKDNKRAELFIRKEYIDNLINKECKNNDGDKKKKEYDSEDDSELKNKIKQILIILIQRKTYQMIN